MKDDQKQEEQGITQSAVASSDWLGVGERHLDGEITCKMCGCETEWERCHAGCDEGYFDGYEDDPLWYDPGDLVPCSECGGRGGHLWCANNECKNGEITKTVEAKAPNNQAEARR